MQKIEKLPTCIGFIMDGNRRWAKAQNIPTFVGHKKGAEVFVDTVRWLRDNHIMHAVFYAFSTENWKRSKEEVEYLVELFAERIQELKDKLLDEGHSEKKVRFRFIGDTKRFSPELQTLMREVEKESEQYADTTIWIALSYGGRAEIVSALNEAIQKGEPMDEDSFRSFMWSSTMPDPDIIVRTGGQRRLSNFLTWQSVYSELLFFDTLWPDITIGDLDTILTTYSKRTRNFGT